MSDKAKALISSAVQLCLSEPKTRVEIDVPESARPWFYLQEVLRELGMQVELRDFALGLVAFDNGSELRLPTPEWADEEIPGSRKTKAPAGRGRGGAAGEWSGRGAAASAGTIAAAGRSSTSTAV